MSSLVVLAGQSNAVGFNSDAVPLPSFVPDATVQIWNGSAFVNLQPGVNTGGVNNPASGAWGPEVQFATDWRMSHPGETLYIVKSAQGETGLASDPGQTDWWPSNPELFANTLQKIEAAKAALAATGDALSVGAILWMQGEQDTLSAGKAAAYEANLANVFSAMRADWAGPETPISFGQISGGLPAFYAFASTVREAQGDIAMSDPYAFMTDTAPLGFQSDGVHLDAEGRNALGHSFFADYAAVQTLIGSAGADTLAGRGGNDDLQGGDGDDRGVGGDGSDFVHGNQGSDTVSGENGNDTIRGGQDSDVLSGGAGADFLAGDKGADTLSGGSGGDTFYAPAGSGVEWILDFNAAEGDRVRLEPGAGYVLKFVGGNTTLDLGDGDIITLAGVNLPAGDWIVFG